VAELAGQVDQRLLKLGDSPLQLLDVMRCAQA
jgi:hypothetical protein